MGEYVELPSDHAFTGFLAGLTPGLVLKDRTRGFSRVERKRQRFLSQKAAVELFVARSRAVRHEFTVEQEAVAARWAAKQIVKEK